MPRAFLVKKRGPKRPAPSPGVAVPDAAGPGHAPGAGKDALSTRGAAPCRRPETEPGELERLTPETRPETPGERPWERPLEKLGEIPGKGLGEEIWGRSSESLCELSGKRPGLEIWGGSRECMVSPVDTDEIPSSPIPRQALEEFRDTLLFRTGALDATKAGNAGPGAGPPAASHLRGPDPSLRTPPAAPGPRVPACEETSPDAAPEPERMTLHRSPDAPTSGVTSVARSIGYITTSPTKRRCPRITIERTPGGRGEESYPHLPPRPPPPPPSAVSLPEGMSRSETEITRSTPFALPSRRTSIWAPHRDISDVQASDFPSASPSFRTPTSYLEGLRRFPSPDLPSPPPSGLQTHTFSPPGGAVAGPHQYDIDYVRGMQAPAPQLPISAYDRRNFPPPPPLPSSHRAVVPALRPTENAMPLSQLPGHSSSTASNPIAMTGHYMSPRKRPCSDETLLRDYGRPQCDSRYPASSPPLPASWVASDTQSGPLNMTTIKENNRCRTWRDADTDGDMPRLKPRIPWGIENIPLDEDEVRNLAPKKRRENDPPRYQCDACSKSYATHGGLSKHRQFHCVSIIKKEFSCKHCDKTYVSLGALKMHIRTHTLPCKCHLCGKAFARPWLLQGHIRTHTGEKPYQCAHCGRSFADRSNLRAHLQTHTDIKKYNCRTCSKSFSRMSLLTKHEDGGCVGVSV